MNKHMSQHDESSAGAVIPTKEELDTELKGKVKEKIKYQNNLRKQYLTCMYLNTELEWLREVYNSYDKPTYGKYETETGEIIEGEWLMKKDDKGGLKYGYILTTDGREIKLTAGWKVIRWVNQGKVNKQIESDMIPKNGYGLPYTKPMLRWEYEIKENAFAEMVGALNHMVSEIRKLGFSKEQIDDIKHNGTYIKDGKLLNDMEEKWLKENNPGWGEEDDV